MPRPSRCRRIAFIPEVNFFKPAGIPLRDLKEIQMSVEEIEAIRLKDIEGLEQEQGARRMDVSRPTFQRILASARFKIADALLNGKAIKIDGGNFKMKWQRFRCQQGHEWELEKSVSVMPQNCPVCNETSVKPL